MFFNFEEINELKRLLSDVELSSREIINNEKLLALFTSQFAVRMNNDKQYSTHAIALTLKDLTD